MKKRSKLRFLVIGWGVGVLGGVKAQYSLFLGEFGGFVVYLWLKAQDNAYLGDGFGGKASATTDIIGP